VGRRAAVSAESFYAVDVRSRLPLKRRTILRAIVPLSVAGAPCLDSGDEPLESDHYPHTCCVCRNQSLGCSSGAPPAPGLSSRTQPPAAGLSIAPVNNELRPVVSRSLVAVKVRYALAPRALASRRNPLPPAADHQLYGSPRLLRCLQPLEVHRTGSRAGPLSPILLPSARAAQRERCLRRAPVPPRRRRGPRSGRSPAVAVIPRCSTDPVQPCAGSERDVLHPHEHRRP